jgi:hypothetical protein
MTEVEAIVGCKGAQATALEKDVTAKKHVSSFCHVDAVGIQHHSPASRSARWVTHRSDQRIGVINAEGAETQRGAEKSRRLQRYSRRQYAFRPGPVGHHEASN